MNSIQLRQHFTAIRAAHGRQLPNATQEVACYVSATGSDTALGTIGAPFKTLAKAVSVAPVGSIVYLREGTYLEPLTISRALTISAYHGETVTVKPSADGRASAALIQADNVTLDGLTIDAANRWRGIDLNAAYITLRACEVKNCVGQQAGQYGQGIIVSDSAACHHITVDGCVIHHVSGVAGEENFCHAVYSACAAMIIHDCEMYDIGGYSIHWYASQGGDLTAYNNYMHSVYGGIGAFNSSVLAYNNVIRSAVLGLVARYNVLSALFYFNTLTDVSVATDASDLHNAASVVFQNNVLFHSGFAVHFEQLTPSAATVVAAHNLRDGYTLADYQGGYASAWTVTYVSGAFTPITDDGAAGIKPTTGNPAIGVGIAIASVATDRGGNTRTSPPTLGAWEAA